MRKLAPDAEATLTNIPAWPAQPFKIASCISATMVLPSQPVEHTGLDIIVYTFFFSYFSINPLPATSLTLQYLCADSIKVYIIQNLESLPTVLLNYNFIFPCVKTRRNMTRVRQMS